MVTFFNCYRSLCTWIFLFSYPSIISSTMPYLKPWIKNCFCKGLWRRYDERKTDEIRKGRLYRMEGHGWQCHTMASKSTGIRLLTLKMMWHILKEFWIPIPEVLKSKHRRLNYFFVTPPLFKSHFCLDRIRVCVHLFDVVGHGQHQGKKIAERGQDLRPEGQGQEYRCQQ